MTKTAKDMPFGAAHTYIAYIREYTRGAGAMCPMNGPY